MAHLFNGEALDWNCFNEGFNACRKHEQGNPYESETKEWYSWNKGWNAYTFDNYPESDIEKLLLPNPSHHS